MNFIFIEGLRANARVGIHSREQFAVQPIEVDINFGIPDLTGIGDDISRTIDYSVVVETIRAELLVRNFNLVETLGEFIADLLCNKFFAQWAEVRVSKPGAVKGVHKVGVSIRRDKQQDV
ncbi:MAG: dihydroneopterin aldolase [Azoarcus sp.]|jgi:dihydroneopterin aldolase|nr:dihydroneopterin aldolase [Azoarcus sp.]